MSHFKLAYFYLLTHTTIFLSSFFPVIKTKNDHTSASPLNYIPLLIRSNWIWHKIWDAKYGRMEFYRSSGNLAIFHTKNMTKFFYSFAVHTTRPHNIAISVIIHNHIFFMLCGCGLNGTVPSFIFSGHFDDQNDKDGRGDYNSFTHKDKIICHNFVCNSVGLQYIHGWGWSRFYHYYKIFQGEKEETLFCSVLSLIIVTMHTKIGCRNIRRKDARSFHFIVKAATAVCHLQYFFAHGEKITLRKIASAKGWKRKSPVVLRPLQKVHSCCLHFFCRAAYLCTTSSVIFMCHNKYV